MHHDHPYTVMNQGHVPPEGTAEALYGSEPGPYTVTWPLYGSEPGPYTVTWPPHGSEPGPYTPRKYP